MAMQINSFCLYGNKYKPVYLNQSFPKKTIFPLEKDYSSQKSYNWIGNIKNKCFGEKTQSLLYSIPHKTNLLILAQSFLGNIVEYTEDYSILSIEDKQISQEKFIGNFGTLDEAWCAHTVSALCEMAGINIDGHKKAVNEFILWGKHNKIYKPIKTNPINKYNYKKERVERAKQIKVQTKQMKEGDLIIWKSDTVYSTQVGLKQSRASHIGIFECINSDGTISILEGNANEYKTGKYERYIATNKHEAISGNQIEGELQEINPRDGFIRKTYTPEELAKSGYSGFIDMQSRIC